LGQVKAVVQPGVCRLETRIRAEERDLAVTLFIDSDCPKVKALAERLKDPLPVLSILSTPLNETLVYQAAAAAALHASCVVPAALLKAVEVAAGLALPKDVHIILTRD